MVYQYTFFEKIMKIISAVMSAGNEIEIVVDDHKVTTMAIILEMSPPVKSFHVVGLNVVNQPYHYGQSNFKKWASPIQQ